MPQKVRKLYERCWVCDGTRKTKMPFNASTTREIPVGSDCFSCTDGYVETGLTMGQVEPLVEQRLKQQAAGKTPQPPQE